MSRKDATGTDLIARLNELHQSLASHFETEEAIMPGVDAQHADRHKKQHSYVIASLRMHISALASGSGPDPHAAYEILVSLYYWYVVHIKTLDKELVSLVKAGVAA